MLKCFLARFVFAAGVSVFLFSSGVNFTGYTQNNSPSTTPNIAPTIVRDDGQTDTPPATTRFVELGSNSFLSEREFVLSLLMVILTFLVLVMQCVLLLKVRGAKADQILPSFAVTLIVGGAVFLITAGYSSAQIAPVLGLFGTVAGYLIGKGQGVKVGAKKSPRKHEVPGKRTEEIKEKQGGELE